MNLNQLQYFVTLAHIEHYTRAAEKLTITQPSLSHAISSLEQELGTRLFERQGRNVVLTKYGRMFMQYAEEALAILDTGVRKTKAMTSLTGGRIDIGYIYTQGAEFVPELVANFLKDYPQMEVEFGFHNGVTQEVIKGLREEKYDLVFCSMVEGQKDLDFLPVSKETLVALTPLDHPLAKKDSVTIAELAEYPQIFFNKGSGLRPMVDRLFKVARKKPRISYMVDEDSALAGMVAQGLGVGIVPDVPAIRSMPVVRLTLKDLPFSRLVYMVTQKDKYLSPVARTFIDYVKERYEILAKDLES